MDVSRQALLDLASMSYDLGALVKGRWYLRTWEMGPVEGESEVSVGSSEEDSEDSEDSEESEDEEDEESEDDMTMKE